MQVADLILPVFAVIVTGWLAGYLGYLARDLSDALIHFAYNVAMPALLIVTIAREPARSLLAWRFLIAFGGGSLICFAIVFAILRGFGRQGLAGAAMQGWAASMTNTGFVALPVLQATYGARAVLPAAIATVFVAVVMFPAAVLMQELDPQTSRGSAFAPGKLARHVILNPMVLSTLAGVVWAAAGVRVPGPVNAYLQILADALTACALFAIGLGVSMEGLRATIGRSAARGGQARAHAAHRPWSCDRASARAALPYRSRRMRGGSDRQDGLYPFGRIPLRGDDRRRDHFADHLVLDLDAHGVDLCSGEVLSAGVSGRRCDL
jgi:malonate transporter and related proteins